MADALARYAGASRVSPAIRRSRTPTTAPSSTVKVLNTTMDGLQESKRPKIVDVDP